MKGNGKTISLLPSQPNLKDKVLGIPWGASIDEAKRIMRQRPKTSFFAADSGANIKWHTYLGYFNDDEARIQVHFYQGKMFIVAVELYSSEDQLLEKFNSVKQGLSQRYGPPVMEQGKYLDSEVWWDLGRGYRAYIFIIKISKW
jgi:hypothetical protein